MARPNVNTATREELVDVAGLRPDLADEILKLRRKGKVSLEALDEVPGVGPATLEQLRKTLDFSDQPKNGDDRGERTVKIATDQAAEAGKHTVERTAEVSRRSAEQAADLGKRTTEQVAEFGKRTAGQAAEVTREMTNQTAEVARQGLQVVQKTAGTIGELQREVTQRSAEGAAEFGRTLMGVVQEQTRHNVEVLRALTDAVDWNKVNKAVDWEQVLEIQGEFLRTSLERSAQLTQRYLEVTQAVMSAAASTTRRQAKRAA